MTEPELTAAARRIGRENPLSTLLANLARAYLDVVAERDQLRSALAQYMRADPDLSMSTESMYTVHGGEG